MFCVTVNMLLCSYVPYCFIHFSCIELYLTSTGTIGNRQRVFVSIRIQINILFYGFAMCCPYVYFIPLETINTLRGKGR